MIVARMFPPRITVLALALAAGASAAERGGQPAPAPAGDVFDLAHAAVRVFSDREGLPQNTVHAIERDPRGYLWAGTQDGAARFNGRAWTAFDMPDREVSNYVRSVVAARDGSVWFGREDGGAVRLKDGALHRLRDADAGLPAGRVNELLQARDGTIWAATLGGGAARFDGARFVPCTTAWPTGGCGRCAEVRGRRGTRRLVAGGEGGLVGARRRALARRSTLGPGGAGSVNAIVQPRVPGPARVWVGTYGGGVDRRERLAGHARPARRALRPRAGPERAGSSRTSRSRGARTGAQQLWASTRDGGLFRLDGDRFVGVPLGASITEIYSLHAGGDDDPGALWVGTRTSGLLRLGAGVLGRARPLLGSSDRPGARFSRDSRAGRPAGLLGGHRERARGDPRQPADDRGRGRGSARTAGARRGRAARARPRARDLGVRGGPRAGAPRRRALAARRRSASFHRGPRGLAAGHERGGRRGRALGRHRAQRPRANGARALDGAHHERRPALEPRRRAARDRGGRPPQPVGRHARRRHRAARGRPRGRVVEPRLRPAERRRDVAGGGAAGRRTAGGLGGHAGRRRAAQRRRKRRVGAARPGLGAAAAQRDGALGRPGQGGSRLPWHAARRRAAERAPTFRGGRVRRRGVRARRRPAERDSQLGPAPRLARPHLDRNDRRRRAVRPLARGHVQGAARAAGAGERAGRQRRTRAGAGRLARAPGARPQLRVRAAHAAPRRRGALPHAAARLRRRALAMVGGAPEELHQPARGPLPLPGRGARGRARLGARRARLHAAGPDVAAAVGDRARGAGRDGRGRRAAALPRARAAPARRGPRVAGRRAHAPALGGQLEARRAQHHRPAHRASRTADGSRRTPRKSGAAARAAARASRS